MEKKMSIIEHLMKNRCRNITMTSEDFKNHIMSINFYLTKEEYEDISKNALGKQNHGYLLNEYQEKIKLTQDEYIILKNINEEYQWIVRDKNNDIFVYKHKPKKSDNCCWYSDNWISFIEFNHLFQFVKWEDEEPTNIQELLNNCEVVEDE